jgi:hypothetical protein
MESDVKGVPPLSLEVLGHRTAATVAAFAMVATRLSLVLRHRLRPGSVEVFRWNHASIWAFRAIASFGSVRGHILEIGPPHHDGGQTLH